MRVVEPAARHKYVVHFRPDRPAKVCVCGREQLMGVVSMAKTFGWAESPEAMLTRVEQKLRTDPVWAAFWHERFGTGRFYAVLIDAWVEMPEVEAIA